MKIINILLCRHGYGMIPEEETGWAWVYLLLGLILGVVIAA